MYKLLIVDDDELFRMELRQRIDWTAMNVEIVGEASDGIDALIKIETLVPDVVISDVRMPRMDGIELTSVVAEKKYDLVVIILSGYKDFSYVKSTLELGVFSYLLKPINEDEIRFSVVSALKGLEKKRKESRIISMLVMESATLRKKLITDCLQGTFDSVEILLEKLHAASIDLPQNGTLILLSSEDINNYKLVVDDKEMARHISLAVVEEFDKHAVAFTDCIQTEQIAETFGKLIENVTELGVMTIIISDPYFSISDIARSFSAVKKLDEHKLIFAVSSVLTSSSVKNQCRKSVIDAINYICTHYFERLTIKTVADALYVSVSHLAHSLKEDLGLTFNERLTDYRLKQAKIMLATKRYKIYEIAEAVGYNDVKYFGRIFKKATGLMPSVYQREGKIDKLF